MDWMYTGQLPDEAELFPGDVPYNWIAVLHAYKAADVLMVDKLHNGLIAPDAAFLFKHGHHFNCVQLANLHKLELRHTKYYQFVLKSVISNMMSSVGQSQEKWNKEISPVKEIPDVMADLLTAMRDWSVNPWEDFLQEDLTEFYIQDAQATAVSPVTRLEE